MVRILLWRRSSLISKILFHMFEQDRGRTMTQPMGRVISPTPIALQAAVSRKLNAQWSRSPRHHCRRGRGLVEWDAPWRPDRVSCLALLSPAVTRRRSKGSSIHASGNNVDSAI
jgi:hypothetical protein